MTTTDPYAGIPFGTADPDGGNDWDDDSDVRAIHFRQRVSEKADDLRVMQAARELLRRETDGPAPPMDAAYLGEVLTRDDDTAWLVEGLLAVGGRMLLVAQRKTGKTTALLNLARDLCDGGAYLGRFPVTPVDGTVGFLNYEVTGAQLARWADDVGVPHDRMLLVNLRGRRNPLRDPDDRAALVDLLREHRVAVLMVDPFGRAFTGQSQNDAAEVGPWLVALDALATDAEVGEVVLTTHAGWNGERTRGSSALEDWADVIVTMVRDEDSGERYFRAIGRDVEVDEDRLTFDAATRSLTLAGTGSRHASRAAARMESLTDLVVRIVTESPGQTASELEESVRASGVGVQRGEVSAAARAAAAAGRIDREKVGRSYVHNPSGATLPDTPPIVPGEPSDTSRPVPIGRDVLEESSEVTLPGYLSDLGTVVEDVTA